MSEARGPSETMEEVFGGFIAVWFFGGLIAGIITQAIWGVCDHGCGMNSQNVHVMLWTYGLWYGLPFAVLAVVALASGAWMGIRWVGARRCLDCGHKIVAKHDHEKGCLGALGAAERSLEMERRAGLVFDGVFLQSGYARQSGQLDGGPE